MEVLNLIDKGIIDFSANIHNPFLDKIMIFITTLGNVGFIWLLIAGVLIVNKKYRSIGIVVFMAIIIQSILGEGIIKNIVQRERPFLVLENIELIIKAPTSYSFPSGHTAAGMAAAITLLYYFGKKAIPFLVLAILIAFSRVYLYVHYPTDIIGGMLLGALGSYIAIILGKRFNIVKEDGIKKIFYKK